MPMQIRARYAGTRQVQAGSDTYSNTTAKREWLYNSTKEQRQIDPGSGKYNIGVTIDTDDTSIADADLVSLVANSAGITCRRRSFKDHGYKALFSW